MGLSRTVSEIDGDFIRKLLVFFPRPCILCPHWRGSPRNWAWRKVEKLRGWRYRWSKNFSDRFSRLKTTPACDRQTDKLQQQRPRYEERRVGSKLSA